ncbi:protein XRI1 isoform X2 [Punica granatum]|uniref:Protein XRI1 isoform X2 n=1 Tax=Punica granatum TaxID=22663 RepID=A0A218VR43_PUNGR|nr:protein XRI1 isoform X2 [Punica granatum]OWM62779.1 hypothetical protein CDL15_Pgr020073 [Punica granatum]
MDCDDNGGAKPWNWQPEEDSFQKDTNFDISQCIWTEVTQNEEDISYMFDETTPVKACGDLAYNAAGSGNMNKELEECSQSYLQVKRRRMLQFDSHSMDPSLCCHETSSAFLRSDERDDSIEEVFPNASQLNSRRPVSCDEVDQSTDVWLANCFNDTDMNFSHDDVNYSGMPSDVQIDISEFWNDQPDSNVARVQQVNRTPQKIVFRGRKSYIRPPPKLASSVAYPFAFIKPCGAHGDVTLKDINQRIRTPPPHKTKQSNEDPSASYPTSAFSGKPVVGKMKIRTEGGKGSITVMRTKG